MSFLLLFSLLAADVELHTYGALRAMYHEGRIGETVNLAEVVTGESVYAVGALADLAGEITVVGGVTYLAYPAGQRQSRTRVTNSPIEGAALLVSAEVDAWQTLTFERSVPYAELDDEIARLAASAGFGLDDRFPFLIEGALDDLRWHVIDGKRLKAGGESHEDHLAASVRETMKSAEATLVGFYSSSDAGVFTHMGSRTHVHCVIRTALASGHVDHVVIPAGASLRLPANVSDRERQK